MEALKTNGSVENKIKLLKTLEDCVTVAAANSLSRDSVERENTPLFEIKVLCRWAEASRQVEPIHPTVQNGWFSSGRHEQSVKNYSPQFHPDNVQMLSREGEKAVTYLYWQRCEELIDVGLSPCVCV